MMISFAVTAAEQGSVPVISGSFNLQRRRRSPVPFRRLLSVVLYPSLYFPLLRTSASLLFRFSAPVFFCFFGGLVEAQSFHPTKSDWHQRSPTSPNSTHILTADSNENVGGQGGKKELLSIADHGEKNVVANWQAGRNRTMIVKLLSCDTLARDRSIARSAVKLVQHRLLFRFQYRKLCSMCRAYPVLSSSSALDYWYTWTPTPMDIASLHRIFTSLNRQNAFFTVA